MIETVEFDNDLEEGAIEEIVEVPTPPKTPESSPEFFKNLDADILSIEEWDDENPLEVRQGAMVRDYVANRFGFEPSDRNHFTLMRDQIAQEDFQLKMPDNGAFFGALKERATKNKEATGFYEKLDRQATLSALLGGGQIEADFGKQALSDPVFNREKARATQRWKDSKEAVTEQYGDMIPMLRSTFRRMQSGGEWITEASKVAKDLDEDEKTKFLVALRDLATTFPTEEIESGFKRLGLNLKKSGRGVSGAVDAAIVGGGDLVREGGTWHFAELFGSNEQVAEAKNQQRRDEEWARAHRKENDFVADVRRVFAEDYDPIRPLAEEGSKLRAVEDGVYAIPGAVTTTAMAFVPGAGLPMTYGTIREFERQKYRGRLLEAGVSRDEAAGIADRLSTISAAPQVLLEKLQANIAVGKLPVLNKIFGKLDDVVASKAIRGLGRFTAASVSETGIELTQELTSELIQDLARNFQEEIPDVEWQNGEDGVFDGYFNKTITTFVAVAPLSIIPTMKGLSTEKRAEAVKLTSPLVRKAWGITEADNAAIDSAVTPGQQVRAMEQALINRDPQAEGAKEASVELEAQMQKQKEAQKELENMGAIPGVRTSQEQDGFEVYEAETGDTIALVETSQEAAETVFDAIGMRERASQEHIDALVAKLEAGRIVTDETGVTQEIEDTKLLTTEEAGRMFEGSDRRISREQELLEISEGGTGEVSKAVFGNDIVLGAALPAGVNGRIDAVTKLFGGSSIFTLVHEKAHQVRRTLIERGELGHDEQVSFFRSLNKVLAGRSTKDGQSLEFGGFDSDVVDETALDEGWAQFAEIMLLKSQNGKKSRLRELLNKNLSAMARSRVPGASKFASFIRSMRAFFGLNLSRAAVLDRAERSGDLDAAEMERFRAMVMGETLQDQYESEVVETFEDTFVPTDDVPFSLGNSAMADSIISDITARVRDPEARADIFENAILKIDQLKRDRDELIFGGTVTQKALSEQRLKKSLQKEADFREAARREELETQAMEGLENEARALGADLILKVEDMPIHGALIDQGLKLISKGRALKDGRVPSTAGDFDDAPRFHPSVSGGDTMPDVAAQVLTGDQGNGTSSLLELGTVNELYAKLETEWDTVKQNREVLGTAEAKVKDALAQAKDTAREEAQQWLAERVAEQKKDHNPLARLRRSLAMLDAILLALPVELRGKVGGFVQLAKLNSDEKRLEFLQGRIAKLDKVVEDWVKSEHRKQIDKLFERARPKKTGKGVPKSKIAADFSDRAMAIERMSRMTADEVDGRMDKIQDDMAEATDQNDIDSLTSDMVELMSFGNIEGMNAQALDSFFRNLNSVVETGKMLKDFADEQFKAEADGIKEIVNHDVTGGGGPLTSSQAKRRAKESERLKGLTKFHRQNVSFEWLMNNLARENKAVGTLESETHKRLATMVHSATHGEKRANMEVQKRYQEFLSSVFGGLKGLKLTNEISKLMEEVEQTGIIRIDYAGKGAFSRKTARASNIEAVINGDTDLETLGMNTEEWKSARGRYDEIVAKSKNGKVKGNRVVDYQSPNVGAPDNLTLSQDQAINLTMLFRQEGLKESMIHEGYTEEAMKQMGEFLSPEAKAIRDWLTREYADNYHTINNVFKEANGVSLPQTEFYSPARRLADGKVDDLSIDSRGGSAMSTNPNFTISRTKSFAEVDQTVGALSIYMRHMVQTNHYVAWANPTKMLRTVFSDKGVKKNINDYAGDSLLGVISERIEWMADGGNRKASHLRWMDNLRAAHTYSSLAFNWSIAIKQLTSLPAYAFDMSFKDFGKYAAKFMANPVKNIKEMASTDYVKTRFKEGYERDVIDGLRKEGGIIMKGLQAGMLFGKAGDIVPVMIGGWMARQRSYDNAIADGMSEAEAQKKSTIDFEMITDRAQQAGDLKDLSTFQGGGSIFKLFTMYKTSPRQYYANVYESFLDAKAGKKGASSEFGRRLLIGQVILPLTFQFVSDVLRSPFDGEDEDFEPENYLRAVLMGPLNGLFIAGDFAELGFSALAGAKVWDEKIPIMDGFTRAMKAHAHIRAGEWGEGLDDVARGLGKTLPSGLTFYDIIRKELKRFGVGE